MIIRSVFSLMAAFCLSACSTTAVSDKAQVTLSPEMKDMVENIEKNSKSTFEMIHRTIYELLMYREKQQLLATIAKEAEDFHNAKLIESLQMVDQSILDYIESKLKIGMEKNVIKKVE